MATFQLLAAIDVRGGRVVRLRQGDFDQETVYADDPVVTARELVDAGAPWLHVVDLDGARTGRAAHAEVIEQIVLAVGDRASVEVAGGLRTRDAVDRALAAGAARAVVGTAALSIPGFAAGLISDHGAERIAIALDVRDGMALGAGWVGRGSGHPAFDAIVRLGSEGATWFEVTAISRDGMLSGPDLALLEAMVAGGAGGRIIASGGIGSVADIRAVAELGCAGAIVGRALYDGTLTLAQALEAASAA